jgi:tetratricopeptide (TPR) repeat protein
MAAAFRLVLGALALAALATAAGCRRADQPAPSPAATTAAVGDRGSASYVGRAQCARCHQAQEQAWKGSHHDLAMQEPTPASVIGDFANASFTYNGITSRFSVRDGKYVVRTDGPDGQLRDFPVAYVFGVYPLQQYLIGLPGGRYQALSIAWDARPRAQGGQRWYHLYPGEKVTHGGVLHWTSFSQNWNAQCAVCHSTNLRKGYDRTTDSYTTTWSEIDVSCEACHGPGSAHVAWADRRPVVAPPASADPAAMGLTVSLRERRNVEWEMQTATGIARRRRAPTSIRAEVEVCAPCHSRRAERRDGHVPGQPFLMSYRPALLSAGLYRADGQMQDEVYNYGSFLQSRMHAAGVTCSDCHDPHSLKQKADGNTVCSQCHLASTFDVQTHHGHTAGSPGASCIACHMPTETYMGVDQRHDHSFRIPRPDVSERFDTPNACTDCHTRQTPAWAATALDRWRGKAWRGRPHFAETFALARLGRAGASGPLAAIASDARQPAIVRASAVETLETIDASGLEASLDALAADSEPLVRMAVAGALQRLEPAARARVGGRLLDDAMPVIRMDVASALAGEAESWLLEPQRRAFARGLAESQASERFNADRPESYLNAALLEERRGNVPGAMAEYEAATRYAPWFLPAFVNLAELQRRSGNESGAEQTLRRALVSAPREPSVLYALGLSVYRQQRPAEAVTLLGQAALNAPDVARYPFAYALALESQGKLLEALTVIDGGRLRHPDDRDLLDAGLNIARKADDMRRAREYLRQLVRLAPDDPALRQLATSLGVS